MSITWTEGGTTKSINNNNIVYANGTLIDEIWAKQGTNVPVLVYKSNSILRATGVSSFYGPAAMNSNGRCMWGDAECVYSSSTTYSIKYGGNYLWVLYPPISYGNWQTTNLTLNTKYRYCKNPSAASGKTWNGNNSGTSNYWLQCGGTVGSISSGCSASITGSFEYNPTFNITYTYTRPLRVVVKVTAARSAVMPFIVWEDGYSKQQIYTTGNSAITSEQVVFDGLMDSSTRNYQLSLNTKYNGVSWTPTYSQMSYNIRFRGGLYYYTPSITRTIEIYDPDTGTLIASNTSALSTTYTARAN